MNSNNIKVVQLTDYQKISTLFVKFNSGTQNNNFFTSTIWLDHWFDFFWQENWLLQSYAIYKNEELIALAPFYINIARTFPFIKTLQLLGQGEPEQAEVASEYLDILIIKGYEQEVYPQVATLLSNYKFDIMAARAVFSDSHIAKVMLKISGKQLTRNYARYSLFTDNFSLQDVSKNTRSRLKRSANQLSKLNAEMRWSTINELNTLWPILIKFHQSRWHKEGSDGVFSSDDFNQFHQMLIKNHSNSVAASAVFVNNQPIAINYYLVDDNTYYFYQSGWDEVNYAKLSPGLYLHYWSIENCPSQYYDFMMGGLAKNYKAKFCRDTTPMQSLILVRNPFKDFVNKVTKKITKALYCYKIYNKNN